MEQPVTFEYIRTVRHCIDSIANPLCRLDVEPRPKITEILLSLRILLTCLHRDVRFALSCSKSAVQSTGSLTTLKVTGFCIP